MINRTAYLFIALFPGIMCFGAPNKRISLEDKTKAVFMYHFTKYIRWPGQDSSQTFTIAILGASGIVLPLKEIEKKKTVKDKRIKILPLEELPDTLNCHILFVSKEHEDLLPDILKKARLRNILTIGATKGFGEKGVAINFLVDKGKIKFEINGRALDALNLKVSSQLLKLARFVKEKEKDD